MLFWIYLPKQKSNLCIKKNFLKINLLDTSNNDFTICACLFIRHFIIKNSKNYYYLHELDENMTKLVQQCMNDSRLTSMIHIHTHAREHMLVCWTNI